VTLSLKKLTHNIEINITDTGSGIPANEQAYIFDRYKQVNKTTKQGYGLGLAIVKKIMDLHETTIIVLSKPKEGSSFIFNLPMYQVS
jgi:signal transduction histidine kinase